MSKRRRLRPMEFPLVEVIAFPGDVAPVSVILPAEWELTGEVQISLGVTTEQIEQLLPLVKFIENALADELWLRRHVAGPPFEVTGGTSSNGSSSE